MYKKFDQRGTSIHVCASVHSRIYIDEELFVVQNIIHWYVSRTLWKCCKICRFRPHWTPWHVLIHLVHKIVVLWSRVVISLFVIGTRCIEMVLAYSRTPCNRSSKIHVWLVIYCTHSFIFGWLSFEVVQSDYYFTCHEHPLFQ